MVFFAALSFKGRPVDWMTFEEGGLIPGVTMWVNDRAPRLATNGTGVGVTNAFAVYDLGNVIALRASWKLDEDAPTGCWLRAVQQEVGSPGYLGQGSTGEVPERDERFQFISLADDDSVFALETTHELFVTAEGDGNGSQLVIDRNVIGEWQQFSFVMLPDKLTNEHPGGFLRPLGDGQSPDEPPKPPIRLKGVGEGIPKNALGAGRPDSSVAKESMKDKFGKH